MAAAKRTHFFVSLAGTTLVLYMFAMFGLLVYVGQNLGDYLRENIVMHAYLQDSISPLQQNELKQLVLEAPFVKEAIYIDKEKAAAIETESLGQDFVKDIGYNPLPNCYELYLKADHATPDKITAIKKHITACTAVAELRYQDSQLELVEQNFAMAKPIALGLSILFAIIAIILINNTVRLNIFSQRFLIKSMQLVGATERFIMRPFLMHALRNGVYAGFASAMLVFNTGYVLLLLVPDLQAVLPHFTRQINLGLLVWLLLLLSVAGVAISMCCTWLATRKYLRTHIEELY